VLLYQRADTKNPTWYARYRIDGRYKVSSLKTGNPALVEVTACETYDEMRFKMTHDIPIFAIKFDDLCEEFLDLQGERVKRDEVTARWVKTVASYVTHGVLPYFGKQTSLATIGQTKVDGYMGWRMADNKNGNRIWGGSVR
jgi:hypothetical protein